MTVPGPPNLGIDLGGTKIAAVVLAADGAVIWETRVPSPREDYSATIEAVASLVVDGEGAAGQSCSVGIGIPGALSRATGLVRNANSTWLIGRPFHEDLERRLGRPIRLANDANCLALSEAIDGAGAGADVVFAVILGTGVGGGLVVNGHVVTGVNAIAGEWGHNPLPLPRGDDLPLPQCYCGRQGCVEAYLSGPALARDAGAGVDAPQIVARAAQGDARCEAALARYEERLARALASVINVLDPDVIVLGGGLSNVDRLYANVPRLWLPYVFSDQVSTRLARHVHGDSSGVRGAAWLWSS